jgi:hypothetical protein
MSDGRWQRDNKREACEAAVRSDRKGRAAAFCNRKDKSAPDLTFSYIYCTIPVNRERTECRQEEAT